jgi:hypothetical protein
LLNTFQRIERLENYAYGVGEELKVELDVAEQGHDRESFLRVELPSGGDIDPIGSSKYELGSEPHAESR